jgi:uncharacterized protein with HEPN domain
MRRDEASLLDIAIAIRRIQNFVSDRDKEALFNDTLLQSSILYQFTVIGEAVRRISTDFRLQYSQIPWPMMIGMRNKLVHEYDDIDLFEVWNTIQQDLPILISQIEAILPSKD